MTSPSQREEREAVHVLLIYSLQEGKLLDQRIFDEAQHPDPDERSESAAEAYFSAERENRNAGVEIVLLASDSIASIHATHGSYFSETVRRLASHHIESNEDDSSIRDSLDELIRELAERGLTR